MESGSAPRWPPTTRPRRQELTARTKPQFATGPQKWVVLGPVGLLTHEPSRVARLVPCLAALMVRSAKHVKPVHQRCRKSTDYITQIEVIQLRNSAAVKRWW